MAHRCSGDGCGCESIAEDRAAERVSYREPTSVVVETVDGLRRMPWDPDYHFPRNYGGL